MLLSRLKLLTAVLACFWPMDGSCAQELRVRVTTATTAVATGPVEESEFKRSSLRKAEALAQLKELSVGAQFQARDSLDCTADSSADANQCLSGLTWQPTDFTVVLEQGSEEQKNERLVRFDSPKPQGDSINDRVAMEWHMARDQQEQPIHAPAMIVVHESGSNMAVGRLIAKGLRSHGIHTFMLQMPGYGVRRTDQNRDVTRFLPALKQAIADVRRARDAISVLPLVDNTNIGVQGTSLGGFVTANVAGLDAGFQQYFILLAGGNLAEVIFSGQKDAAKVRQRLEQAGATREMILEHVQQIEPLRLAHRVQPQITWLYSGKYDDVVPPACSTAFAQAAKLPAEHHIELPVNHYTGIVLMPKVLAEMSAAMGIKPD
jgi:dienelactone hydrolase